MLYTPPTANTYMLNSAVSEKADGIKLWIELKQPLSHSEFSHTYVCMKRLKIA